MALLASAASAAQSAFMPSDSASSAPGVPTQAELQSWMKKLTKIYDGIKRARDTIVTTPARMARDLHGRTLPEDVRENVLATNVRDHLDSLLRAAGDSLNANDLSSAQSSLMELATILKREGGRQKAIAAYWERLGPHRPNRRPYLNHLQMNGLEPRYSKQIEAAEAGFEQQIEGRQFIEAMGTSWPRVLALYEKAAREEAAQVHAAVKREDFTPFRTREGALKCARATRKTSGSSQPAVVSRPAVEDYYPAPSMRAGEAGYVVLEVLVARNGCPVRADVAASSGYERLDSAALKYALHASYRPGQMRGHAIGAWISFPLRFELAEESRSGARID